MLFPNLGGMNYLTSFNVLFYGELGGNLMTLGECVCYLKQC